MNGDQFLRGRLEELDALLRRICAQLSFKEQPDILTQVTVCEQRAEYIYLEVKLQHKVLYL